MCIKLPKGCIPLLAFYLILFHYIHGTFDCITFHFNIIIDTSTFPSPGFVHLISISLHIDTYSIAMQLQFNALLPFSTFMNSSLTWILCVLWLYCMQRVTEHFDHIAKMLFSIIFASQMCFRFLYGYHHHQHRGFPGFMYT